MAFNLSIKDLKEYIDLYSIETVLFQIITPIIQKKGYISFDHFYQICMWKTGRQKNRYLKNKDNVESITRQALAEKDEHKQMEILCTLNGVSVPVASALLTVSNPSKYGIIDIRCLEMLKKLGKNISKYPSIKTWIEYLKTIREMAKINNVSPREIDMALFAIHREYLQSNNYRSLYKKYLKK